MPGRGKCDTHPGDIWYVLATKPTPFRKTKNLQVHDAHNIPYTAMIGDVQYYHHKGETITIIGQHYTDLT
jgi:hypothetical protein